jgi:thioesterase domain-containing protein
VTLFRTGGHPLLSSFDDQFGWGELAQGGVEVRLMPGGHGNILDEPHVRAVAQSLQSCLRNFAR